MLRRPLGNEGEGPWREPPSQHSQGLDGNDRPLIAVAHVEVRRGMIVVEHRDDDTEEAADLWHHLLIRGSAAAAQYVGRAQRCSLVARRAPAPLRPPPLRSKHRTLCPARRGWLPEGHWRHLRTTNIVESPFAAVRLRTAAAKRFKKVVSAEALIWKLLMIAERTFRRLNGPKLLKEVYQGREFVDGVTVNSASKRLAA